MEKINDLVNTLGSAPPIADTITCATRWNCAVKTKTISFMYGNIFTRILRNILKKAAPVWNMLFVPS